MTTREKTKINFKPDNWKIKVTDRSKNRMKFQLKLNQDESEAFKNFSNSVKPDEIGMEDFVRSIFFAGIRTLEEQLTSNLVKHIEENREDFEASGFTFDPSGNLTGVDDASGAGHISITE